MVRAVIAFAVVFLAVLLVMKAVGALVCIDLKRKENRALILKVTKVVAMVVFAAFVAFVFVVSLDPLS